MKLLRPAHCGAVSHGGRSIDIGLDGYVDVAEAVAFALLAHGFTPVFETGESTDSEQQKTTSQAPEDDIGRLNRPALFALLKAKGISVSLPITNEDLRQLARQACETVMPDALADSAAKGS
jgi:hypothetical protein